MEQYEVELIERLQKESVYLYYGGPGGCFDLGIKDIGVILEHGIDEFIARKYDVPVKDFVEWKELRDDHQCRAITQKGIRCKHERKSIPNDPTKYIRRKYGFCPIHSPARSAEA